MEKLLSRYQWLGYPLIRVGIGFMISMHGLTKLFKGSEEWEQLGLSLNLLTGLPLPPVPFGFTAACVQALGGAFVAVGLLTRLAAAIILPTMLVAVAILIKAGEPFSHYSHPIEISILLIAIMLMGSGSKSLDEAIKKSQKMKLKYNLILIIGMSIASELVLTNCNGGTQNSDQAGADATYLIIKNAKIAALNQTRDFASALAVKRNKLNAVGIVDEVAPFDGHHTQLIDAKGSSLIPGLIESHSHVIQVGLNYNLALRWDGIISLREALPAIFTCGESIERFLKVFEEIDATYPISENRWIIDHTETISESSLDRTRNLSEKVAIQKWIMFWDESFVNR